MPRFRNHRTNVDRLLSILTDGRWHTTRELARRVSHSFGSAKFEINNSDRDVTIECEPHPSKRRQWRYRLVRKDGGRD